METAPTAARNLADLVRSAAARTPEKTAFVEGDRTLTWAELDERVDRLAGGLERIGCRPGERVGLALPNGLDFVACYFAVLRAGLAAVPINTGSTVEEMAFLLADSGAGAAVYDSRAVRALADAAGQATRIRLVDTCAETAGDGPAGGTPAVPIAELEAGPRRRIDPDCGAEDLAVLLYTAGTTGRPRGAMLSHRALLANLAQVDRMQPKVVTPDDVVLLVLPLFHVYGLNAALGSVAWAGATGVLLERFDPVQALATIRTHRVTSVVGAPPMYVAWSMLTDLGDSLASVRLAVSGSAPLPPGVHDALARATGHQIYEGYGLTETAPVLTSSLMSGKVKPGSVGRPIPGVELRLLDEAGEPVEDGDPGEIVVRGANLFSGYWPAGSDGPDGDGWFATGDVAYADPDGDLFLVGRLRELILVSGFNVYPAEVEAVLERHPEVVEAAVVGIPHPYTGEAVKAFVVKRPGSQLEAGEVIEFAAGSLARFKCPTAVEFVDELPHSVAGKVAKGRLAEAN
jgi:long-chain acyl-CoA synthetase